MPPPRLLWQAYTEASEDTAFLRRLGNHSRGWLIPVLSRQPQRAHVTADVTPAVRCRLTQRAHVPWRHAFKTLWPADYAVEVAAHRGRTDSASVYQAVLLLGANK